MVKLSEWERIIVITALSLLSTLSSVLTNPTELAGLAATIQFLQALLANSGS